MHSTLWVSAGVALVVISVCPVALSSPRTALSSLPLAVGQELFQTSGGFAHRDGFALSPDGETCATSHCLGFGGLRLWQTQTGHLKRELKVTSRPMGEWMVWLAFSPDGGTLARGSDRPGGVQLWDLQTGRLKQTLAGAGPVSFSPDGKLLASGDAENEAVQLWDAQTGRPVRVFARQKSFLWSLAFSPDGTTLISGCFSGGLKLWDVQSGALKPAQVGNQYSGMASISFSPDGRTLALSNNLDENLFPSDHGEVQVWDVQTGSLSHRLPGHPGGVSTVAFSPQGTALASGNSDGTVQLWDAASGQEVRVLKAGDRAVDTLAFLPSGTKLLSGNAPLGELRLWDAKSGKKLQTLVLY
jgi:WD40 repeat protein